MTTAEFITIFRIILNPCIRNHAFTPLPHLLRQRNSSNSSNSATEAQLPVGHTAGGGGGWWWRHRRTSSSKKQKRQRRRRATMWVWTGGKCDILSVSCRRLSADVAGRRSDRWARAEEEGNVSAFSRFPVKKNASLPMNRTVTYGFIHGIKCVSPRRAVFVRADANEQVRGGSMPEGSRDVPTTVQHVAGSHALVMRRPASRRRFNDEIFTARCR